MDLYVIATTPNKKVQTVLHLETHTNYTKTFNILKAEEKAGQFQQT